MDGKERKSLHNRIEISIMGKGYSDNEIVVKAVATIDDYVKSLWGDPFEVSKCLKATLGQAKRYWREGKGYTLGTPLTPDDVMELADLIDRIEPLVRQSVVKWWERIQAAEIEKKKKEMVKQMRVITFRELLSAYMNPRDVKYQAVWQGHRAKIGLRLSSGSTLMFVIRYKQFESGEYKDLIDNVLTLADNIVKANAEILVYSPRMKTDFIF